MCSVSSVSEPHLSYLECGAMHSWLILFIAASYIHSCWRSLHLGRAEYKACLWDFWCFSSSFTGLHTLSQGRSHKRYRFCTWGSFLEPLYKITERWHTGGLLYTWGPGHMTYTAHCTCTMYTSGMLSIMRRVWVNPTCRTLNADSCTVGLPS